MRSGRLKILAVTGAQRAPQLPDVPTLPESGAPDVAGVGWLGLYAAAGTPGSTANTLHRHLSTIRATPDLRERLNVLGMEPAPSDSPEALTAFMRAEVERWVPLARSIGLKPN